MILEILSIYVFVSVLVFIGMLAYEHSLRKMNRNQKDSIEELAKLLNAEREKRTHLPEHVDLVIVHSDRRPDQTVDRPDGNGIDVDRPPSGIDLLRSSADVDRFTGMNTAWINALIEHKLGTAARDLVADIYETADRDWNLAHIHNADFRGPDLSVRLPKGESLIKVGARKFRFVVSPVTSDLKNSPEGSPSGSDGADRGEPHEDQ